MTLSNLWPVCYRRACLPHQLCEVYPYQTVGTVRSQQEALEECKALAQTWLAEPGAALPDVVASSGTTGERVRAVLPSAESRML